MEMKQYSFGPLFDSEAFEAALNSPGVVRLDVRLMAMSYCKGELIDFLNRYCITSYKAWELATHWCEVREFVHPVVDNFVEARYAMISHSWSGETMIVKEELIGFGFSTQLLHPLGFTNGWDIASYRQFLIDGIRPAERKEKEDEEFGTILDPFGSLLSRFDCAKVEKKEEIVKEESPKEETVLVNNVPQNAGAFFYSYIMREDTSLVSDLPKPKTHVVGIPAAKDQVRVVFDVDIPAGSGSGQGSEDSYGRRAFYVPEHASQRSPLKKDLSAKDFLPVGPFYYSKGTMQLYEAYRVGSYPQWAQGLVSCRVMEPKYGVHCARSYDSYDLNSDYVLRRDARDYINPDLRRGAEAFRVSYGILDPLKYSFPQETREGDESGILNGLHMKNGLCPALCYVGHLYDTMGLGLDKNIYARLPGSCEGDYDFFRKMMRDAYIGTCDGAKDFSAMLSKEEGFDWGKGFGLHDRTLGDVFSIWFSISFLLAKSKSHQFPWVETGPQDFFGRMALQYLSSKKKCRMFVKCDVFSEHQVHPALKIINLHEHSVVEIYDRIEQLRQGLDRSLLFKIPRCCYAAVFAMFKMLDDLSLTYKAWGGGREIAQYLYVLICPKGWIVDSLIEGSKLRNYMPSHGDKYSYFPDAQMLDDYDLICKKRFSEAKGTLLYGVLKKYSNGNDFGSYYGPDEHGDNCHCSPICYCGGRHPSNGNPF